MLGAKPTNAVPNEIHLDKPEEHNGRIRSFKHERGNWATYVHIPGNQYAMIFQHTMNNNLIFNFDFGFHWTLADIRRTFEKRCQIQNPKKIIASLDNYS